MHTHHTSFEFRNATLGETMPVLFGWWAVQPPPAGPQSFAFAPSSISPTPAEEPVWAISLASNQPFQADEYIANLSSGRDEAERQLHQLSQLANQPVSFAAETEQLSPEVHSLLTDFQELDPAGQGVAFTAQNRSWPQAIAQFQALLHQIGQSIGQFAWVATRLNGQLLARTHVNWLGDFNSLLALRLSTSHQNQHQQALIAALASRTAILEIFSLALNSATQLAKLPVLLSTPAGAILAIPLILRFINNIITSKLQAKPAGLQTG